MMGMSNPFGRRRRLPPAWFSPAQARAMSDLDWFNYFHAVDEYVCEVFSHDEWERTGAVRDRALAKEIGGPQDGRTAA